MKKLGLGGGGERRHARAPVIGINITIIIQMLAYSTLNLRSVLYTHTLGQEEQNNGIWIFGGRCHQWQLFLHLSLSQSLSPQQSMSAGVLRAPFLRLVATCRCVEIDREREPPR